jgi:hypothetical protein
MAIPKIPATDKPFSAPSGNANVISVVGLVKTVYYSEAKVWSLYRFYDDTGYALAVTPGNGLSQYELTPIKWSGNNYSVVGDTFTVGDVAAVNIFLQPKAGTTIGTKTVDVPPDNARITESGYYRITEDGRYRVLEG